MVDLKEQTSKAIDFQKTKKVINLNPGTIIGFQNRGAKVQQKTIRYLIAFKILILWIDCNHKVLFASKEYEAGE